MCLEQIRHSGSIVSWGVARVRVKTKGKGGSNCYPNAGQEEKRSLYTYGVILYESKLINLRGSISEGKEAFPMLSTVFAL